MEKILFFIFVLSSMTFKPVIALCPTGCTSCVNGTDNCITCNTGFYKVKSGELSNCLPCPPYCNSCFNSTYCTLCNDDFYIQTSINETNGNGQTECIACTNHLCSQCSYRTGLKSCDSCGYPNMTEENVCTMSRSCKKSCVFGCDDSSYCVDGCIDDYTGHWCSFKCLGNCLQCKQFSQVICESCRDGFYSQFCDKLCPTNCKLEHNPTCRFDDGFCLNGCYAGFWGDHCNNECSNHCLSINNTSDTCDRDGSCLHGCIDGYFGSNCEQNNTYTSTPSKKEFPTLSSSTNAYPFKTQTDTMTRVTATVLSPQERTSASAVIGGWTAGAIVLVALIITISVICFRRRMLSNKHEDNEHAVTTYYNMPEQPDADYYNSKTLNQTSGIMFHTQTTSTEIKNPLHEVKKTIYDQLSVRETENEYSDKTASVCDVPDGRDPCIYNSNMKMPYIATRNPSVRYTSYTDDDEYCDLFALVHGQWYSTFYNMTNYCVDHRACGSNDPMYLNGTIPQPSDGIVNRTACVRTFEHCCEKTLRLRIKNCHYFMVYCFVDLNPACHSRFCLDTDTTFGTALTSTNMTKANTTTPSSSSARVKKLVEKPEEHCQEKHTACLAALIVMVVYSVFISIVAVVLVLKMNGKWKVCCQHRARVGGKIYQQKEGFPTAFDTKPTVKNPPDCHAKI